jgi:hypothetical protein
MSDFFFFFPLETESFEIYSFVIKELMKFRIVLNTRYNILKNIIMQFLYDL